MSTVRVPGPPPFQGPPFDASQDPNATMILCHGIFMFIALAIAMPTGAFFARYYHGTELFQAHYWIQTFGTVLLSLIGFILALLYHNASLVPSFTTPHSIFGLFMLFWLVLQQIGGAALYYFFDEMKRSDRQGKGVWYWAHAMSGFLCMLGCIASIGLGIWNYGQWYGVDTQLIWILIGSMTAWFVLFTGLLAVTGEYCVPPATTKFAGLTPEEENFRPANAAPNGSFGYNDLDAQIERDRRAQMEMMSMSQQPLMQPGRY
ncbi:hypothetical protein DFJ74DRAFT_709607 [Hyaloraphidium curvatum]|nr:hypothetical protein DFJ74DRAFT_709607 [Hyaloraphidium curvatum]